MGNIFRIVTWNCYGATERSGVWDYLLEMDPDVALLQEVNAIPDKVRSVYTCQMDKATRNNGLPQHFSTAILVKGRTGEKLVLPSPTNWMEEELERFSGNLVAREILPNNSSPIKAISVYNPNWAIDPTRLRGIDLTGVRLTQQKRKIWVGDLLWASLRYLHLHADQLWRHCQLKFFS